MKEDTIFEINFFKQKFQKQRFYQIYRGTRQRLIWYLFNASTDPWLCGWQGLWILKIYNQV